MSAQHSDNHGAEKSEDQSAVFECIRHCQDTGPNATFHQVQQGALRTANENHEIIITIITISMESESATKSNLKLDLTRGNILRFPACVN